VTSACQKVDNVDPLDIGNRLELFTDSYLVDRLEGAELRLQRPQPAGVALHFDEPWAPASAGYVTVLKDGDTYRMYYRKSTALGSDDGSGQVTCYAESADGIVWRKPPLGLHAIGTSADNNIVHAGRGPTSHNFSPFVDGRPGVPPSERLKALAGTQTTGLLAFESSDGLRWRQWRDEPVLPSIPGEYRYDSQNVAFWSEHEGCYVCYFRAWQDGYRTIARTTSHDFVRWSSPTTVSYGNTPPEHLYINQTHPYYRAPHIYISLAARFMQGRKVLSDAEGARYEVGFHKGIGYWQDCSEAVLMTSRGGARYDRTFMEGFVRPGPDRRNWVSRCNYPALGVVPTGAGEMSLYVHRHNQQPTAHLERLTLRVDGFASLHAPYAGGRMVTKPLRFDGRELVLNYATGAAGHVLVGLQDDSGEPIRGYSLRESTELVGDEVDRVAGWERGSDLGSLAGLPVRLHVEMVEADLYSIQFR
jgi:hypothetical protein